MDHASVDVGSHPVADPKPSMSVVSMRRAASLFVHCEHPSSLSLAVWSLSYVSVLMCLFFCTLYCLLCLSASLSVHVLVLANLIHLLVHLGLSADPPSTGCSQCPHHSVVTRGSQPITDLSLPVCPSIFVISHVVYPCSLKFTWPSVSVGSCVAPHLLDGCVTNLMANITYMSEQVVLV